MVPPTDKPKADKLVLLEMNPAGHVDVLGEPAFPLLTKSGPREFTPAEAKALLELRNGHGTPLVRIVGGK